ncbi:type IV pilin protein [Metabacillus indicus]|uniref:type IV pilin protein n=1 Tax=Metabacillus indicus TaxID=246786 RepID=UPI0024931F0E|nr:type II secretion system protein [Metabacillus indicus]
MFKKMLKNERGLTLIELLAVVVILGIIAAIAVPSISGIIKNSKEDAVITEASQIIDAAKLFVTNESPAFTSNVLTITKSTTGFDKYLDTSSNFTVKVTETSGKFTYAITGHEINSITTIPAFTDTGGATEAEIKDHLN